MAAESFNTSFSRGRFHFSFNEAAANGRGNLSGSPSEAPPTSACFNEAAANGRGNRRSHGRALECSLGFNEAAANGRGNL